ncbi:MAG: DNA polymerase IV [Tindallia sp. MSAO_Bac2]|nr:MAG: DNA polymerase IV [Tindallia sp. MSAO_Bac2]
MERIVLLVDMNAFYISCEMSRNSALKNIPAAVAGDPQNRTGIVLAANYSARNYGVKTAMTLHEAFKKCPDLVTIAPDHTFYNQRSKEVMSYLHHFSPVIEQNSIDEAWLDITGTEKLFGSPFQVAEKIMTGLKNELDLWCSIGISDNKFLSKMAADMKKPLGITELWPKNITDKLWPMPAQAMYGVGNKTMEKLKALKISTIGEIAAADVSTLVTHLGSVGMDLHRKANGIDSSPVVPHLKDEMKSIGRSTTLKTDAYAADSVRSIFLSLAEDVGIRARNHRKKGTTIQITIKFNDFKSITRQTTTTPTFYTKDLFDMGFALLKKHWPAAKGVRLIGISLTGFDSIDDGRQMSMFDSLNIDSPENKLNNSYKIDEVMDSIRKKHGSTIVSRASLIDKQDT